MEMFNLWQIWSIAALALCVLEIFTPAMFFLNLGFAGFVAALVAAIGCSFVWQVSVFGIFSIIFIIWLRPVLLKHRNSGNPETVEMYIGKNAKVLEKITKTEGKIAIFGEEWQARALNEEEFFPNTEVRIVKNDSTVMFVEKPTE